MEIIENNIIDPTQFDPQSNYFDPKSNQDSPRWHTVKVKFRQIFDNIISLNLLKKTFNEQDLLVVKKGNRLSILPVSQKTAIIILETLVYTR